MTPVRALARTGMSYTAVVVAGIFGSDTASSRTVFFVKPLQTVCIIHTPSTLHRTSLDRWDTLQGFQSALVEPDASLSESKLHRTYC